MSTSRSSRTVVTATTCDSSVVLSTTTKEVKRNKPKLNKDHHHEHVSFWKKLRIFRPHPYLERANPKSAAAEKLLLVVEPPPPPSSSLQVQQQLLLESELSREREMRKEADQRAERLEKQFQYYQQELSASQQDVEHWMLLYEEAKETLELHKFYYSPHLSNLDLTLLQKSAYVEHESDDQVGPYELCSVLGNGTHGTVFKAFDTDKKKHVAIKRIPKNNVVARVDLAQLEYEITILREAAKAILSEDNTTARNIVPLVDFVEGTNSYYMVMPMAWLDAYSLRKRLFLFQGCTCHRQTVQKVMQGVFTALDFLHTHMATAHMDVKPENILIMGEEERSFPSEGAWISVSQVRLTDFGFALPLSASKRKALDEHATRLSTKMLLKSQESICRGTRGFYAPELLSENQYELDLRAVDMWAAGCTLMDLMMGLPDRWMECYHRIGDHVSEGTLDNRVHHKMEMRFESILTGLKRQMKCKPDLLDLLLDGLIVMDPKRRLSATEAMDTDWMVNTVHTTTIAGNDEDPRNTEDVVEDIGSRRESVEDTGSPRASF